MKFLDLQQEPEPEPQKGGRLRNTAGHLTWDWPPDLGLVTWPGTGHLTWDWSPDLGLEDYAGWVVAEVDVDICAVDPPLEAQDVGLLTVRQIT